MDSPEHMDNSEQEVATFEFGDMLMEGHYKHRIGDEDCNVGWCGGHSYPCSCECDGCTGLVHANFGDEYYDGDYWLYTQCDVCGESE